MTEEQLDMCKEFTSRALDIINQEAVWEFRRRYSSSPEEEARLHQYHQKMAWNIVKQMFCDNQETLLAFTKSEHCHDPEIIESINKTIQEEIDALLLEDDSYYRNQIK